MASPKKSVHLPDELEISQKGQEPYTQLKQQNSLGSISKLFQDVSLEVVTMWGEVDDTLRGELVTDAPSTSEARQHQLRSKKGSHNGQPRRKQPAGSSTRQGPSNFTRLPEIPQKPRSLPASPAADTRPPRHHRPCNQANTSNGRTSLSGISAPGFIAGATVAGPLSNSVRPTITNTAIAAAALFAVTAGQTLTAASIAYTTGNGTIAPVGGLPSISGPAISPAAGGSGGATSSCAGTPESGTGATVTGAQSAPQLASGPSSGLPPAATSAAATAAMGTGLQLQISGAIQGVSNGGDGTGLAVDDELAAAGGGGGGAVTGGGGSTSAISKSSASSELLSRDKSLAEDERLRNRLVSLPNIVCRSANGDVFLVDLGNVQAMLHKRELGEEGLAILNRLTPSLAHSIGGGDARHSRRRHLGTSTKNSFLGMSDGSVLADDGYPGGGGGATTPAPFNTFGSARNLGGGGGGGLNRAMSMATGRGRSGAAAAAAMQRGRIGCNSIVERDPIMEMELERHLATTDELVQQHRKLLEEDWQRRRCITANPAAAAKEQNEERRASAIEFAVRHFVPRRLALMALNMPPQAEEEDESATGDNGLENVEGVHVADSANEGNADASRSAGEGSSSGATAAAAAVRGAEPASSRKDSRSAEQPSQTQYGAAVRDVHHWKNLQTGMDRLYHKMPFLSNWMSTIKKMHRNDQGAGWDGLLTGVDDLYVKGREEHQGTNIYVLKCQELGVTPSTQVIQQLSCTDANMAHCHLGRQGAAALRHALSANVTITHLNLQDNHLDAMGLESILAGLYSGTMAKQPRARKLLEKRIQTAANSLANAVNGAGEPPGSLGTGTVQLTTPVATLPPPLPRGIPGDLTVRLIPMNLAKDHEQRRLAEDKRQEQQKQQQAQGPPGGRDGPEWLRLIQDHPKEDAGGTQPSAHLPGARKPAAGAPGGVGGHLTGVHRLTCAITALNLSNNPLGINGIRAIADMLDPTITQFQFIKQLYLNKCGIPEGGGRALAVALSRGNTRLAVLSLSNNNLGNGTAAMFGEVLALPCGLEDLDLSWNQIKADGARALSEGVVQNNTLTRLNLSWNGLENLGVEALGAMLLKNESLTSLDVTNTRMGAEACLILAEGIRNNHSLEVLILNGNSVGDDGARFLMDAVKANSSLRYLGLQGTNMSTAARGNSQAATFNPLSPDGAYTLDLEVATDRAVALQLCQLDASSPADLMRNIKLGDKNITSSKSMHWPDCLPVAGVLSCDFVTRRVSKTLEVMQHRKFLALAAQFGSTSMSDKEKLALVEVMAPFNYVQCHQAATLLRCFSICDEQVVAAALLFTRCADLDENVTELIEALGEGMNISRDGLQHALGWYSYLRFSNPTGHYELTLSSRVHAALAARLKDVAYSEPVEALNWHNVVHDQYTKFVKVAPNFGPPEEWKGVIPTFGSLSFDYVSGVMALDSAVPVSNELLEEVITSDLGINLDRHRRAVPSLDFEVASHQVARLRPVVCNMAFTAEQVKKLVEAFAAPPHRVEVLVICYCLIVDRSNIWTILYAMDPLEQALAMWRLGPANLFDKAHPSGHYVLDLNNAHHESIARKLVDLALASPELPNFWNVRVNGVKRSVIENRNMWGAFMAETQTPFMEFDFIGLDGWELLGRSRTEVDALGPGDRLDLRTKQARRMELSRIRTMYAYYEDGSGCPQPPWQSRVSLMRALSDKAPWQAAWDRMARVLLRCELRRGGVDGDSPIEDIFYSATSGEDVMMEEQFEALLKEWGYNRLELAWVFELFDSEARPANPKDGPAYKPVLPKPSSPGTGGTDGSTQQLPIVMPVTSPIGRGLNTRNSRQPSQLAAAAALASVFTSGLPPATPQNGDSTNPLRGGSSRTAGLSSMMAGSGSSLVQQLLLQQQQQQLVPNLVVEFPGFVRMFTREPPRMLKSLHSAMSVTMDGVELAARPTRKSAPVKTR